MDFLQENFFMCNCSKRTKLKDYNIHFSFSYNIDENERIPYAFGFTSIDDKDSFGANMTELNS